MNIREAKQADVDDVLAFWSVATLPSSTDDDEAVGALVEHAPGALLLAVGDDGAIVATVIAGWDGWRGTMYRLAVAPEHRRHGVARALVFEAERWLRSRGARRLHLIVDEGQPIAQAFWSAAGYTATGQTRFVKSFALSS